MSRRRGGGDGCVANRSTGAANLVTVADRNRSLMSAIEGPQRPRCCAIIALSPKMGVYTATASTVSRCDTIAATARGCGRDRIARRRRKCSLVVGTISDAPLR